MDASTLKQIDLFKDLPDDALQLLADRGQETTADEGDVVIKAGAFADQLVAIADGTVEVQRKDEVVAKLGPGDVIGEAGVVKHELRNATVVATSPLKAITIAHSDIKAVRRDNPDFDQRIKSVIEDRGGD